MSRDRERREREEYDNQKFALREGEIYRVRERELK